MDTERWKRMNKWKIGALVGGILGLTVPYIPMMWIYYAGPPATYWPPDPSLVEPSMEFYFVWSLLTILGALIGASMGYLIDNTGDAYDEKENSVWTRCTDDSQYSDSIKHGISML